MKWYCFIFLCYVCVVKCHSIAVSEIEDFSNFLKETSQLDQNVKSSFPGNDYDDDEAISDDAWEESGKFEGDLILNERQRRLIVANVAEGLARNGLTDTTKRWPNNEIVYFIQQEHFTSDQVQAIQNGIDDLARSSCVKFTPYKKGDRDAVVIQGSRRGCFSQVGYQGGYQVLNLSGRHPVGRGCFRHGTVVHELLHTLGFYHMQSSHDRDDYIDIIWENIVRPARHNFRKYNSFSVSDFGVGYDYDSVLHYSRKAFSANGQDTIVPKQGGSNIGQRIGLSDKDVQKLNKMYCDANSDLADENSEPKKPVTKKKPKNRPFEGHGIGYQQGKTVIIKLPTSEQSEVAHSPQIMYHFSSEPKTMQETAFEHGFGFEKEIDHDFHPLTLKTHTHNDYFPQLPNQQQREHSNKPEVSNIHSEVNEDTSDDNEGLNEALHRFAGVIKTHKNPYPTTFDYDYSKYINLETRNEKPKIQDESSLHLLNSNNFENKYGTHSVRPTYIYSKYINQEKESEKTKNKDESLSLHTMNSDHLENKYSIHSGRPIHLTQDKMNEQFYNYDPEDLLPELRSQNHEQSASLKLIDPPNYEYGPTNLPLVLRNQTYVDGHSPEKQFGIQKRFSARGRIPTDDSYRGNNEAEEPNHNKHYIYEGTISKKYPSIEVAHITERYMREPYTPHYSFTAPVSHNWNNHKDPNYENYKNKYPGSAEDYR